MEEGGDLVAYFGQVEFHMPLKYPNGGIKWEVGYKTLNFQGEIWAGNINMVFVNTQIAFKAMERKRGQRTEVGSLRGRC